MDGTRLRQSWYDALDNAQTHFRQLLTSHSSSEWKRLPVTSEVGSPSKGKARASNVPELTDVIIHRRASKSGESIYRAVLEVPVGDDPISLAAWKSVLVTPELRKEWDPAVEGAQLLEMFDQATRISKVNFSLGWPANPRDAVTISRTFNDATTLIDISTSLPRSADEPAYLRPSPPYVRSDVALFGWCIQRIQPQSTDPSQRSGIPRLRITCFWQHNFRLVWSFSSGSSLAQQLAAMTVGLYKTVQQRGKRVPLMTGYGNGVSIERIRFAVDREALTVDYSIVPGDEDHPQPAEQNLEELHQIREARRLTRSIEFSLPSAHGWDVQLSTKGSSEQVSQLPWTAHATRAAPSSPSQESSSVDIPKFTFIVKHAELPNDHAVLKVHAVIELSGPSSSLRLNGIPQPIEDLEPRDPSSYFISQQMFQDASSMAEQSFHTQSSIATMATSTSKASTIAERPQLARTPTERSAAAEKSILSRVKRNYIYFSSLLQEPEAKWKQNVEARGVSVSQLDSIDPTLVVYRAEATFVGISLWDLYASITTPGARTYWDKQYDDSVLLEDVNELTELWHFKTKPAWPVNGRDMVVLKTVYKSPTTIHVFAFSADDPNLFPQIPPVDPSVIRTQVDLQGWAIEALSPNTTLVTLLEQSDPKGWSNKASIPQQMITAVAGVGEFAIKCGGPPVTTRLESARANQSRYDHERGSFRIEYEGSAKRRTEDTSERGGSSSTLPVIECEIRCDLDTWASSLDIVVDPPPQSIAALRRHRFSSGGGGLWLTITHDAVFSDQERLQVIVRRGPMSAPKDKGLVMVNGAKVEVDVEEMPERDLKNLTKQKRVKPTRVPLDQPPVLGVIRRRRAEWDADKEVQAEYGSAKSSSNPSPSAVSFSTTPPSFATSFSKFFTYAVEQATTTTQQAVAAISPAMAGGEDATPSSSKLPMQYALDALAFVQDLHASPSGDGWTLVSEKDFPVQRKVFPEVSPVIPVHKGEKVIEGVAAEEIASVLTSYDCRKQWDTRFDSVSVLEAYSADAHTAFVVMKGGFPFRDRGFFMASLVARGSAPAPAPASRRSTVDVEALSGEHHGRSAIYCVAASFSPESVSHFASSKYNVYSLPVGRVFLDAWILETLDPYSAENYAIPSTRCTRAVAVDYAGSIPAAVNSMINGMLPKSILAIENYLKNLAPSPLMRLPAAGFVLAPSPEDKLRSQLTWTLRRRDAGRTFLSVAFNPATRVYSSLMILNGSTSLSPSPPKDDRTPRPSRLVANPAPPSTQNLTSSQPEESRENLEPSASESRIRAARSQSPRARDVRRSSSIFTPRGEVRLPVDLLVSELIVDSKLYPSGYDVQLRSRIEKDTKHQLALPAPSDGTKGDAEADDEHILPVACAAYTLPPSPLHSAGLNVDRPPRHLLRFTLPTAQYQMTTIVDPLTGETRSAPAKPQWLLDLEEGRAIIDVCVRPATTTSAGASSSAKKAAVAVSVNGGPVRVMSEKESLTALGRDELLDGRAAKADVLARSVSAGEQVPAALQTPLAVAQHLLEAPVKAAEDLACGAAEVVEKEGGAAAGEAKEDAGEKHMIPTLSPAAGHPPESAATGFMRFLNLNQSSLLRFSPSRRASAILSADGEGAGRSVDASQKEAAGQTAGRQEGEMLLARAQARTAPGPGLYPLSTVIIVALIAFLVGSLLRSLLSPADFIYVVTDEKEIGNVSAGWREIKRLFEVKYVVGGWDFQIAVVRRH